MDNAGTPLKSIDPSVRGLYATDGTNTLVFSWDVTKNGGTERGIKFPYLFDMDNLNLVLNPQDRYLYDDTGNFVTVDFGNGLLKEKTADKTTIDWNARLLKSWSGSADITSIDWANRLLKASDGTTTILDYSTDGTAGFGDNDITTTGIGNFKKVVLDYDEYSLSEDTGLDIDVQGGNGLNNGLVNGIRVRAGAGDSSPVFGIDSKITAGNGVAGRFTMFNTQINVDLASSGFAIDAIGVFKQGDGTSNYFTSTIDGAGAIFALTGNNPIFKFSQAVKGEGGFQSSDGTAGITDANTGTITDVQSKDGLVTSVTRVSPVADATFTYDDGVNSQMSFTTTSGIVTSASVSTAFDSRLMSNIVYVSNVNTSKYLTPVKFSWNKDGLKQYPSTTVSEKTGTQTGYLAQDVQKFYPICMLSEQKNLTGKMETYLNFNKNCVNYYLGSDLINKSISYETKLNDLDKRLKEVETKLK